MNTFGKGGVHPSPEKLTAGMPVVELTDCGEECVLLLSQSIGKPAECVVHPGEYVRPGSLVAKASGPVSANVHSPAFGQVRKIDKVRDIKGFWQDAVIIRRLPGDSPEFRFPESLAPGNMTPSYPEQIRSLSSNEIISAIMDAGVVGLGGATFPTAVKVKIPDGKKVDTMIVNGAECEPYLTCDDAIMRTRPEEIMDGAELLARAVGASRIIVGIEENKPEAIQRMTQAATRCRLEAKVVPLRTRYPQGGEKQLIFALTKRTVPAGGLPVDVRVVVDNVATALAVWDAVAGGRPLYRRVITVSGPSLPDGGNFLVPIGTPLRKVIEAAGGLPEDTGKVISGGPMMGQPVVNLDAPVTKGCGGITIFPESMSRRTPFRNCIRCAKCVDVCPMGLQPFLIARYGKLALAEEAVAAGILNCMECGCCSYVCPSARPLVDWIRLAKAQSRKLKK